MKTFLRRLAILEFLKNSRHAKTTPDIIRYLENAGYLEAAVSEGAQKRLIQRDMNFLLGGTTLDDEPDNDFGLETEAGDGRTLAWRLDPYGTHTFGYERMPSHMALAFSMTRKHLSTFLPRNTLHELERFFERAETKLSRMNQALSPEQYGRLKDAVEFHQRGQSLKGASIDVEILDAIYLAIIKRRQIRIQYRQKNYDVHPYGVVVMLPKLYLVARKNQPDGSAGEFRNFLVHKIDELELLTRLAQIDETFRLSDYLKAGSMEVMVQAGDRSTYELHLRIPASATQMIGDIEENPISNDQRIEQTTAGFYELKATVHRTIQLRNWLLGLGEQAEVVAPEPIRQDLLDQLDAIRRRYVSSLTPTQPTPVAFPDS